MKGGTEVSNSIKGTHMPEKDLQKRQVASKEAGVYSSRTGRYLDPKYIADVLELKSTT